MKKLYGYYGGSRAYGLPQTESSDWDYYSVGTSTKIKPYKIYPNVKIHQKKRTQGLDVESVELCAYFTYLMNGFAFQVESLWVHKSFMDYLDPVFEEEVLNKRRLFIDRGQLIENVTCNIESFRKKTVEDIQKLRTDVYNHTANPKLRAGVDRMLQEYKDKGYYHKDYLHGIRLLASLVHFLKTDIYPIKIGEVDKPTGLILDTLKTHPAAAKRSELDCVIDKTLEALATYGLNDDEDKFRFDSVHALSTLKKFYP
jgi:hypothetical protein